MAKSNNGLLGVTLRAAHLVRGVGACSCCYSSLGTGPRRVGLVDCPPDLKLFPDPCGLRLGVIREPLLVRHDVTLGYRDGGDATCAGSGLGLQHQRVGQAMEVSLPFVSDGISVTGRFKVHDGLADEPLSRVPDELLHLIPDVPVLLGGGSRRNSTDNSLFVVSDTKMVTNTNTLSSVWDT